MFKSIFKSKILEFSVVSLLILIGVSLRLLPHFPNFSPIMALTLFGGVYLNRKIAFLLPIIVMVISDIFIGYYDFSLMIFVYMSFLICVFIGFWLKKHKRWYTILGSSILAATIFFLITNFAVWFFTPWYGKNIFGLVQCFLMALPFFRNTLLGDLFYLTTFFGTYEIVKNWFAIKFKSTKITNEVHY